MSLDYGLRISQPGYDVKTCTDAQCVFTSKSNTLKVYLVGYVTINIPSNTNPGNGFNITFNHNLGFIPAFLVLPNDGLGGTAAPISCIPQDLGSGNTPYGTVVDNCQFDYELTTVYVKFYLKTYDTSALPSFWGSGTPARTINFKYYIFTQKMA